MREHGTRAKYVADRCRCQACTAANSAYQRERARYLTRVAYGIETARPTRIDATEAREHLRWLSTVGVGKREAAKAAGLSLSAVQEIRSGRRTKCNPSTASKILAVSRLAAAPGARIDAGPTWRLIEEMLQAGYTRESVARFLGSTAKAPALQISRDKVTAAMARRVEELHHRLLFRSIAERQTALEMENERQRNYRRRLAAGEVKRRPKVQA